MYCNIRFIIKDLICITRQYNHLPQQKKRLSTVVWAIAQVTMTARMGRPS
jgi:hypothetical protein